MANKKRYDLVIYRQDNVTKEYLADCKRELTVSGIDNATVRKIIQGTVYDTVAWIWSYDKYESIVVKTVEPNWYKEVEEF